MQLNERLSELRKNHGLTQSELGAKLNVSAQAISKWELGSSEPDITTLTRLAEIYKTTLAQLLDPSEASQKGSVQKSSGGKYDLYLSSYKYSSGLSLFIIRSLGGCAGNLEENSCLLFTRLTANEVDKLTSFLSKAGIAVNAIESNEANIKTEVKTDRIRLFTPLIESFSRKHKPRDVDESNLIQSMNTLLHPSVMKERFKKANLRAFLIGFLPLFVLSMIFLASAITGNQDEFAMPASSTICLILSFCLFALIFNVHYDTFSLYLVKELPEKCEGCFSFVFLAIPNFLFCLLEAPIEYILTLWLRIKRTLENNLNDLPTDKLLDLIREDMNLTGGVSSKVLEEFMF